MPDDVTFHAPEHVSPPRSRFRRALRRLWYAGAAWFLNDEQPDAGRYREAVSQLRIEQAERIRTQVALAVRTAERDSAEREVQILGAALKRLEETINADVARQAARREKLITQAKLAEISRAEE